MAPSNQPLEAPIGTQDQTNQYLREVLHAPIPPPPINVRYFYTSPLAIDDPLSPLPPPLTASSAPNRQPPRPFSIYDNDTIDKTWLDLRKKILKYNEDGGASEKRKSKVVEGASSIENRARSGTGRSAQLREQNVQDLRSGSLPRARTREAVPERSPRLVGSFGAGQEMQGQGMKRLSQISNGDDGVFGSLKAMDPADMGQLDGPTTTGTPFIRAPSRKNLPMAAKQGSGSAPRPMAQATDSYNWDDDAYAEVEQERDRSSSRPNINTRSTPAGPTANVPVGVSRLHNVVMPELQMEPIYWSPVNDIAPVVRGTWFYKDTMLPVEIEVANMLEAGYVSLQCWTETWKDELNSAVEVGAIGETKIVHKLWPEKRVKQPESRPGTSRAMETGLVQNTLHAEEETPEKQREVTIETAGDLIDISTGPEGPDNKAAGKLPHGRDGRQRLYLTSGVIYADENEAYILRPNLQPSAYYGRRPLANYIRKGRKIGICVVRGFDQAIWDKLHPPKKGEIMMKAREGVSSSQAGVPPQRRAKLDYTLAGSERPQVTDLVLVIHGIGQKLSERIESFHFTHAINAFRREVNVELGADEVKCHLRPEMGGVMVLPVNWRMSLSFEEGGYRDESDKDPGANEYSLKDITPETLPSVRGIISDVMLDIPYYLSQEHNPKMIAACIKEANRIYRLWCKNNPGFAEWGRVHLIAHSLGSVMSIDILSKQPAYVPPYFGNPLTPESDLPTSHFIFDTKSLFVCGSPVGFFLLLKKTTLMPRRDRNKPGADSTNMPGVVANEGTYGCIAVDNIYNIVNPYDPVAYRLNATVDATYAAALKPALVPSSSSSWFSNPFRSSAAPVAQSGIIKSTSTRLPSNVELETHNFSREEVAERKAYALNDNGQIDWFLRYGGGALEIQYLTMLGAHSSYWISRDFVRFVVVEVGRRVGREGTVFGCRAVKRKGAIG